MGRFSLEYCKQSLESVFVAVDSAFFADVFANAPAFARSEESDYLGVVEDGVHCGCLLFRFDQEWQGERLESLWCGWIG